MDRGTVKWFDYCNDYGFIITDYTKVEIRFQSGQGCVVCPPSDTSPPRLKLEKVSIPLEGSRLVFETEDAIRGTRATAWAYAIAYEQMLLHGKPKDFPQTQGQKQDLIFLTKPGDRLRIVFTDKPLDNDLRRTAGLFFGLREMAQFDEAGRAIQVSAVLYGRWPKNRECTMTVLSDFDPHIFGRVGLPWGLFEKIERTAA